MSEQRAKIPSPRALVLAGSERAGAAQERYLGLTVIERVVRNLRARGIEDITIAGSEDLLPTALRSLVRCDDETLPEGQAIGRAVGAGDGPLLVLPADVVTHPQLPPRLLARHGEPAATNALCAGETDTHAVLLLQGNEEAAHFAHESLAGVIGSLDSAGQLDRAPVIESWSRAERDGLFVVPFARENRARARRLLLKLNWRPHDGIIAGLVNKHMSVPLTTLFVNVPFVTPNVMTGVAFLVALVGIALVTQGSYLYFVLGAGLVQVQSILDGCDGELARLRYLSSSFGAWFDTVVDDLIGVLWVSALGIGVYRMTGQVAWMIAGITASVLYTIALGLVYTTLIVNKSKSHSDFVYWFDEGRDPHTDYPDKRKISTWLTYIVRRDFYVLFFFVMAVVGLMPVAAVLSVLAATSWFAVAVVHVSKRGLRLYGH